MARFKIGDYITGEHSYHKCIGKILMIENHFDRYEPIYRIKWIKTPVTFKPIPMQLVKLIDRHCTKVESPNQWILKSLC